MGKQKTAIPRRQFFKSAAELATAGAVFPQIVPRHVVGGKGHTPPSETLYVGDGSSQELSGAARCDIQPILLSVDLSNTYDPQRTDLEAWKGPTIRALSELPRFLEETERV